MPDSTDVALADSRHRLTELRAHNDAEQANAELDARHEQRDGSGPVVRSGGATAREDERQQSTQDRADREHGGDDAGKQRIRGAAAAGPRLREARDDDARANNADRYANECQRHSFNRRRPAKDAS